MVSVCMATFNGAAYVGEQIASILPQLEPADELIVSDDSSTDNTLAIITSIQDIRIRILPGNVFRNPTKNFENALRHARGGIILLSDQDDVWLEGRVSRFKYELRNCDLAVSDCHIVAEDLSMIAPSYFSLVHAKPGFIRNLMRTSSYVGCCMGFNRAVLERALPFPAEVPMHDFWIAMVAEAFFKISFINVPLSLYRRHGQNASYTGSKSKNSLLKKFILRKKTILPIIRRAFRKQGP